MGLCYGGLTYKGLSLVFQLSFWVWAGLTFPNFHHNTKR
jgi:hypothetical protein